MTYSILSIVSFSSDAENGYSYNMTEHVDIVEVKTEPNETDELFSACKNTKIVDNSRNDETTSGSKIYISLNFKLSF